MKKSLIMMAAAALLLAGCAKEMDSPVEETPHGMKTVTLKASYDAELTKTTYEGDKTLTWSAGDKIGVGVSVDGQIQTVAFELTDGAGSPSGTFTGQIPENGAVTGTAFYPWNGAQSSDAATGGSNVGGDGNIYFHLFPETAWSEDSAPLLLAAQFDNPNAIVFKQAAGAIKVILKEVPADADKLVLTVDGKEISGWFALNPANAGTDAITTANAGTGTSQLAYTFATAEADRDMTFYFPLPAIELPSFNVELFAGNASLWSKASTKSRTITRGKILRMPELTVEVASRTYYLVGYIDGADYYGNDYKFDKEGNLETTLPEGNNYVYIKRGNGGDGNNYYFAQYCEDPSGTVWRYNDGQGEKMLVPGGQKLAFTLVPDEENPDKMTLSYRELVLGLSRVWGFYKEGDTPWYAATNITGVTIAHPDGYGMARGLAMDDEFIYLPKSSAYANVAAVSIADKTVQKAISKSGVSGGSIFATSFVRMIKNTDASVNGGKDILLLCNLTATESDEQQLRLYAYKDGVDAPPTQIAAFCWDGANNTNDWRRYGDRFFVEGDWSSAKVYFPSYNQPKTIVLNIANGARTSVTQINAGENSPNGIKDLTVYPGDDKLFLTNGSIANLVAPTGGMANNWNQYTLSATCQEALNTWGYNFFEFEGKNYIAYARIIGETKAQIEVIEDKGDLITSLTAKEGLMVSPIHDATDLNKEVGTGNLADCCVRVINGEVFIAALTRDGGFVLDKLGWY